MPCKQGWYKNKPGNKTIGSWSWDNDKLQSKIRRGKNDNDCTTYLGSMSPTGALFGAWKKNEDSGEYRQQMVQSRRLVFMSETGLDVQPYRVTMKCGNQACLNFNHFELKETNRPDKQL
jgi:hypothetical protein